MSSSHPPICRIIAGPNGAGKTTFALTYLRQFPDAQAFVNADLIAAGLSPLAPQQQERAASRLMLREIDSHIQAHQSFAFETTLSGRGYLRLIDRLRVAERVAHGGHNVPLSVLRRRFPRSIRLLLESYAPAVDHALCNMNAGTQPVPVFSQTGPSRIIIDPVLYTRLQESCQ
jgi:predicted ABC-type ATPase